MGQISTKPAIYLLLSRAPVASTIQNTIYKKGFYCHIIMVERINGETITGIALVFLAILFIYAGRVNSVWATIFPADFLILAIGAAFIILGMWDMRKKRRIGYAEGEKSHH